MMLCPVRRPKPQKLILKSLVVLIPLKAAYALLVFALGAVKLQYLNMDKLDKLDGMILGQL